MKNILFGWLSKPQYQFTILDGLIAAVEIIVGLFAIVLISIAIWAIVEKIKEWWWTR